MRRIALTNRLIVIQAYINRISQFEHGYVNVGIFHKEFRYNLRTSKRTNVNFYGRGW